MTKSISVPLLYINEIIYTRKFNPNKMLDQSLKDQVKSLFASLKNQYTFQVNVSSSHPSRAELLALLADVAECSNQINVEVQEGKQLTFTLLKNNQPSRVVFHAVPNGHEFTTLLLALLNQEGIGKNLPDNALADRIRAITSPVKLKSYISLTCTNCPDVVQALNIMAFLNPVITHEIIDGAINQQEVEALNIQAVPSVYANGKLLHVGRSTLGELLTKIEEMTGTEFQPLAKAPKAFDVIVAGGGPAGVSAAIYSARKGFKVALVAEKVGGQVTETVGIENMISIPQTTGAQLAAQLKLHLSEYPIDILENRIIKQVEAKDGINHVQTSLGETLSAPALIIATGASWRKFDISV